MNAYASEYPPAILFDASYKAFFESFYATSDTPEAHESYVDYFTQDATLVMASKTAVGRDGLLRTIFSLPRSPLHVRRGPLTV
jgi:hypothetical protein